MCAPSHTSPRKVRLGCFVSVRYRDREELGESTDCRDLSPWVPRVQVNRSWLKGVLRVLEESL